MKTTVNVLMCGGRRTGKTSILAAMKKNMEENTFGGKVNVTMNNAGDLNSFIQDMRDKFDPKKYPDDIYPATDNPNDTKCDYEWSISIGKKYLKLHFTDIPGEWFIHREFRDELVQMMRESQILVIAVDSPHLVEKTDKDPLVGKYHDAFNRPEQITAMIKQAFQGNTMARLVLFVPMKCERYQHHSDRPQNMQHLLNAVKAGYADLLQHLEINHKEQCAVAVMPCMTMGGMEFMQFAPKLDADGKRLKDESGAPLKDLEFNEYTGLYDFTYQTNYRFVPDQSGKRHYAPQDCEQPLYCILLFLLELAVRIKNPFSRLLAGILGFLFDILTTFANSFSKSDLKEYQKMLKSNLKKDASQGFEIINDPYKMFT